MPRSDTRSVRFVLRQWVFGATFGIGLAAILPLLDTVGLRALMKSDAWSVGASLLFAGFAITFGSAACGSARLCTEAPRAIMQLSAAKPIRTGGPK